MYFYELPTSKSVPYVFHQSHRSFGFSMGFPGSEILLLGPVCWNQHSHGIMPANPKAIKLLINNGFTKDHE